MIGYLYEQALGGDSMPEIEHADGRVSPLDAQRWLRPIPGDGALLARCTGPVLDVGAGPGRLTVALASRGIPTLAIDITPFAVVLARSAGALALQRDVFGPLPGTGRWETILLADGNIGIGGDPAALLHRAAALLRPGGALLAEVSPPGTPPRRELVRLRTADGPGPWFPWAWLDPGHAERLAAGCGLYPAAVWSDSGRWFTLLRRGRTGQP